MTSVNWYIDVYIIINIYIFYVFLAKRFFFSSMCIYLSKHNGKCVILAVSCS